MNNTFQNELPLDYNGQDSNPGFETIKANQLKSDKEKWILMFAPDFKFGEELVSVSEIKPNRVISFPKKHCHKALRALDSVANCDNYSTVILGDNVFSEEEQQMIIQKALASKLKVINIANNQLH